MKEQEKQLIYSVLTRLIDDGETLTRLERRDLLNKLCLANCDTSLEEILTSTQNNRKLQIKRGTSAQNNEYKGCAGELTMDQENNTIRVHDGETVGGTILAKQNDIDDLKNSDYVIENQLPDADNNYTWYRRYKSGWIEMGGYIEQVPSTEQTTIIFPIQLADDKYFATKTLEYFQNSTESSTYYGGSIFDKTNTQMSFKHKGPISWYVCGSLSA